MTTSRWAVPILAAAAVLAGSHAAGQAPAARPAAGGTVTRDTMPGPQGREWPSLAYYPPRHDIVMFGGGVLSSGAVSGDTWTWTPAGWTRKHPAASPSPREGAAMAYDGASGQLLLFGGSGATGYPGGTWTWNGTTWTHRTRPRHRARRASAGRQATTRPAAS